MFCKKNNAWVRVCNQKIFMGKGWEGVVKLGKFKKHFVKNTRKNSPQVAQKKTTFRKENLTQRWHGQGLFFQNQDTFFDFQKGQGRPPLSLLVTQLWMWLSTHQYPWICLNILANASINCSDYARAMNMCDHLTCSIGFWRCLIF